MTTGQQKLLVALCLVVVAFLTVDGLGSQRKSSRNRRRLPGIDYDKRPVAPAPIDYSKFSHSTKKHQAACDACHKIPTPRWQQTSSYPDITDYPGHEACVSCHRPQFFRGAKPVICSVCHMKTSPRDDARLPFRNDATRRQFSIEFPHDRHQDVIALLNQKIDSLQTFVLGAQASPPTGFPTRRELHAGRRGRLRSEHQNLAAHARANGSLPDDKAPAYNNCEICHSQRALPAPPATGWADGFQPKAETFKSVPSGHDSCFNCHWKSQQPVASNCAGCHRLAAASFDPATVPIRISLKFMHEGGGEKKNHVLECASCHINITKSATIRGLKPDVPITSCTECHNKVGTREDLNKELVGIVKIKTFVCVNCNSSNLGSLHPPASHYLIAERPPLKRKEIK